MDFVGSASAAVAEPAISTGKHVKNATMSDVVGSFAGNTTASLVTPGSSMHAIFATYEVMSAVEVSKGNYCRRA